MTDQPCSDRHSFIKLNDSLLKCENCPITLTELDLRIADRYGPRKLIDIVIEKERDWYINELES